MSRKPTLNRRQHFHVTLTASEAAFASELGDGNRSRGISLALATARAWLQKEANYHERLEIRQAAERIVLCQETK